MADSCDKSLDPRVRRTRQSLQRALEDLMETRAFEELSVQDIAEAATVNRATFYNHYPDKFALLECLVAARFHGLLAERGVEFDGTCASALRALVLGVCDYLAGLRSLECERQRQLEPHLESAVISVVGRMLLHGLENHAPGAEMIAAAASWAIYGAAKQWVKTPDRRPSEQAADTIVALVQPILPALPGSTDSASGSPRSVPGDA